MRTDKHGFTFGEVCQSTHSAPARYIGHGLCLYISAMDNDKQVTPARKAPDGMWAGVLPTMEMAEAAEAGFRYARFEKGVAPMGDADSGEGR